VKLILVTEELQDIGQGDLSNVANSLKIREEQQDIPIKPNGSSESIFS
jgi:hypothetical protein